jgi:Fur family ferric uptake transcriptional regulator
LDEAIARVRAAGGRMTLARRRLLDDLHDRSGRVAADELAARHPDIDVATVYRSLTQFEQLGIIEHVHLGHGAALYRWAGRRTVAAVCERCGAVVDLPATELDDLADRLRDAYGLSLCLGHFALSVHCPGCVDPPPAPAVTQRSRDRLPPPPSL